MKVFNISLHRTGTQSYDYLMNTRVPAIHFVGPEFDMSGDECQLWNRYKNSYIEHYTSFSDFPIPLFLHKIMKEFPDSKFICFNRNKQKWIKSVLSHVDHIKEYGVDYTIDNLFYSKYAGVCDTTNITEEQLSVAYDGYYADLDQYRHKILFLDLESGPAKITSRISRFTGIVFDELFPRIDHSTMELNKG
jgi:Sulfotransferase domain